MPCRPIRDDSDISHTECSGKGVWIVSLSCRMDVNIGSINNFTFSTILTCVGRGSPACLHYIQHKFGAATVLQQERGNVSLSHSFVIAFYLFAKED